LTGRRGRSREGVERARSRYDLDGESIERACGSHHMLFGSRPGAAVERRRCGGRDDTVIH
jgi:hypothetical protein